MDAVGAGLEAELDAAPRGLLELDHELIVGVADEAASLEGLREHEPGRRLAHVGHHHVPGARELDVVRRVLGTAARVGRAPERLVEGELVGLVEGDLALAGDVRRAPQPGDQVVGEEAAAEALGLLGDLVGRARREKRVSPHVGGLVGEKRGPPLSALEAGDGARGAGVEHGDAHVGGHRVHLVAQRSVRVAVVPEEEPLLVGVTRVVEEELGPPGRLRVRTVGPGSLPQGVEGPLQLAHRRLLEQEGVALLDAAELLEDRGESSRVGHRIPQRGAIPSALVGPGNEGVPPDDVGAECVCDPDEEGQAVSSLQGGHDTDSFVRVKTDWSSPAASSRGGGAASDPAATASAAWRTGCSSNGSSEVTR